MNFVSAKEAREFFKCSGPTLAKWAKQGKLDCKRFSERKVLYDIDSMCQDDVTENHRKNVIYARVSTQKQANDLHSQIESVKQFCIANGVKIDYVYKDIASGMNESRKELNLLINEVVKGNIGKVYISFKDRLTRFGFDYFRYIFALYHTEIIIIDEIEETSKTFQQELAEDLVSIIQHFSMKLYSNERKKFKEIKQILLKEDDND